MTVSYVNAMLPRSERQEMLDGWGFKCKCQQCALSDQENRASESRVRRIKEIERILDNIDSKDATADMGAELIQLYLSERLEIYIALAYARAALNYGGFGMREEASHFATVTLKAVALQFGPQKSSGTTPMELLAQDPPKHWSWRNRLDKPR